MTLQIESDMTPLVADAHGTVRIGSTRVSLESVLWLYKDGYGADSIAEAFPAIALADVHSVIAYYLRHQATVDRYLDARKGDAEQLRQSIESSQDKQVTRAELLARWAAKYGDSGCSGS